MTIPSSAIKLYSDIPRTIEKSSGSAPGSVTYSKVDSVYVDVETGVTVTLPYNGRSDSTGTKVIKSGSKSVTISGKLAGVGSKIYSLTSSPVIVSNEITIPSGVQLITVDGYSNTKYLNAICDFANTDGAGNPVVDPVVDILVNYVHYNSIAQIPNDIGAVAPYQFRLTLSTNWVSSNGFGKDTAGYLRIYEYNTPSQPRYDIKISVTQNGVLINPTYTVMSNTGYGSPVTVTTTGPWSLT